MAKRRPRVVVQMSEVEIDDYFNEDSFMLLSRLKSPPLGIKRSTTLDIGPSIFKMDSDCVVLGKQLLLYNLKKNLPKPKVLRCVMEFDCVGIYTDQQIYEERSEIIERLVYNNENCCLIQFITPRECPWRQLCQLLITEMYMRLQSARYSIKHINLEYFDVRKYDMVNMMDQPYRRGSKTMKSQKQFKSNLTLLRWLQTDYPLLWALGREHEFLDFQCAFFDSKRLIHNVKFSCINLYLCKMDRDTKVAVREFLQNKCSTQNKATANKPLMLTDCLQEYFAHNSNWRSWFFFHVPTQPDDEEPNPVTTEMLSIAQAAYEGSKELQNEIDLNKAKGTYG